MRSQESGDRIQEKSTKIIVLFCWLLESMIEDSRQARSAIRAKRAKRAKPAKPAKRVWVQINVLTQGHLILELDSCAVN